MDGEGSLVPCQGLFGWQSALVDEARQGRERKNLVWGCWELAVSCSRRCQTAAASNGRWEWHMLKPPLTRRASGTLFFPTPWYSRLALAQWKVEESGILAFESPAVPPVAGLWLTWSWEYTKLQTTRALGHTCSDSSTHPV